MYNSGYIHIFIHTSILLFAFSRPTSRESFYSVSFPPFKIGIKRMQKKSDTTHYIRITQITLLYVLFILCIIIYNVMLQINNISLYTHIILMRVKLSSNIVTTAA